MEVFIVFTVIATIFLFIGIAYGIYRMFKSFGFHDTTAILSVILHFIIGYYIIQFPTTSV